MNITLENISFGHSETRLVLKDISLKMQGGNNIAILGPSGCGKSTLLRLISGILRKEKKNHFAGSITIDGDTPQNFTKSGHTIFMFQEPTLMPNLTVSENIALTLKIQRKNNRDQVEKLMDLVGLKEYRDYLPGQLSGGMKTRVALARTFITQSKLVLLDEPFSAVDISWKLTLYAELEKLKEIYNPTIVIVTHDIQEALLLSSHIVVIGKRGQVLREFFFDKQTNKIFSLRALNRFGKEIEEIEKLIINEKQDSL